MISIYNRQRTYSIDTDQLRSDIAQILQHLGYADFAIAVWITNDRTMRYYNRVFRGKDKATDVLSFPFHPDLQPGQRLRVDDPEQQVLGDIIISAAYVAKQARELHTPVYQQLRRLVVHGICHLLGYDHQTDAEYQQMITREQHLLDLFYQKIPDT